MPISKDNVLLNGICFYLKQLALHSVYVLSVHAFHGNQTHDLGVLLFELQNRVWNKAQADDVGAIGLFLKCTGALKSQLHLIYPI